MLWNSPSFPTGGFAAGGSAAGGPCESINGIIFIRTTVIMHVDTIIFIKFASVYYLLE